MADEPLNTVYFDVSPLTRFVGRNHALWECPGDRTPKVRSMSMNYLVGGDGYNASAPPYYGLWPSHQSLLLFRKMTALRSPAMTWVIWDERPNRINDTFFCVGHGQRRESPGHVHHAPSRHPAQQRRGAVLCGRTCRVEALVGRPVFDPNPTGHIPAPGSGDLQWLMQRTSQKK